ncbi:MAG: hypothetical protein EAZ97_00170, partial [Bacteroidetes bacterium]
MAKKEFSIGEIGTAKKQMEESKKEQLLILQELKEIIPPLQTEEYEQLKQNILAQGCREALTVWHDSNADKYILIDGHNRHEICTELKINFEIKTLAFKDIEEVKLWMYNNQLGRRNLSIEQASYLRGKKYHAQKLISGTRTDLVQNLHRVESDVSQTNLVQNLHKVESDVSQTDLVQNLHKVESDASQTDLVQNLHKVESNASQTDLVQNLHKVESNASQADLVQNLHKVEHTKDRLAQEYGVSSRTIVNDAQFAKGIDLIGKENPELKNNILSGKVKINKNQIQALAKLESLPKIESLNQIADILQA